MVKASPRAKSGSTSEDALPSAEDARQHAGRLRAFAAGPGRALLGYFAALAPNPPQVLLLEGGSADERLDGALHWGLGLNCPSTGASGPCLACDTCLRFLGRMHRDLFLLDGRAGSIKIDEVRDVRAVLGEAPREARFRLVILSEAQALTEAAANAMLKSLEEPRAHTVFVLLAPQRERLLPTLVSRSWVLTLPWQMDGLGQSAWTETLATFLRTGCGLFDRTGGRGAVDAALADEILLTLQRALADALAGRNPSPLAACFASLPPARLAMADAILAEAQDSLQATVNPTLVVEWATSHLYLLYPRSR